MKLRLVKFLTSHENEIEKKEEGRLPSCVLPPPGCGRGHSPLCSRSPPPFIFPLSLPPPFSASKCPLRRSSLSAATCRQAVAPAIPPQLFRFSFLLHKITEAARYGIRRVALYSTCRPNLPVQLAGLAIAAPSSPHLAPSPNQVPRLLSGSNGTLSVEGRAIGKQRPKMRFPVSFPSLLNK